MCYYAPRAYGIAFGDPANVDILFPFAADVSNGVTSYNVLCDLCSSSTTAGQVGQTIFNYVPNEVPPGALFNFITPYPVPFEIAQKSISSVRIRIQDNLNRPVNLQDGVASLATSATTLALQVTVYA